MVGSFTPDLDQSRLYFVFLRSKSTAKAQNM